MEQYGPTICGTILFVVPYGAKQSWALEVIFNFYIKKSFATCSVESEFNWGKRGKTI